MSKTLRRSLLDEVFPADIPDSDYDDNTVLVLDEYGIGDNDGSDDDLMPIASEEQDDYISLLRRAG